MFDLFTGDFAWRRENIGSWYVYSLMKVFDDKNWRNKGLLSNLTRANRLVAYLFEHGTVKQMPVFVSMLTADLRFTPIGDLNVVCGQTGVT